MTATMTPATMTPATMTPAAGHRSASGGHATVPATSAARIARVAVLAVGPLACVMLVAAQKSLGSDMVAIGMWVALAFWTPLFPISFPALILQGARDDALVTVPRMVRAVVLLPWLALSPRSAVKAEMWANIAGCLVAAWWLTSHLPG